MATVDLKRLIAKLNTYCSNTLHNAVGLCMTWTHYETAVEHWLLKCLEAKEGDIAVMLSQKGVDPVSLIKTLQQSLESFPTGNGGKPVFSPRLLELLQQAWLFTSIDLAESQLRSGALVAALLDQPIIYRQEAWYEPLAVLNENGLLRNFDRLTAGSVERGSAPLAETPAGARGAAGGFIERFCIDFTAKAAAGGIDPVFGRDAELRQMIDILARRRKNNPILVGEPGVGKTAVLEGLALRIVQGDVPEMLVQVRLLGIDMGLLEAGAGMKGEFENRLKGLIEEVRSSERPIILFIDEAHTLVGAGGSAGSSDAANLLKPALARGELRTCAATTWKEYKKYFEKDPALARRFQLVRLDEPTVTDAALILRGLRDSYEAAHQVVIRDDAIVAAANLSERYISGRFLPDKAIDLLDTACARVKVNLKAPPASLEAIQRCQQALKRQLQGLYRDRNHGLVISEKQLAKLEADWELAEQQRQKLAEQWQQEQQAVTQLLAARTALSASPQDEESSAEDRHLTLAQTQQQLEAIQGDQPLLYYEVTPDLIAQVISDWTGIPLGKVARDQIALFLNLEIKLQATIRGQDEALSVLATGLRAAHSGLIAAHQPRGVFLLVGPSGVGKTECALALADQLFGAERHLVSINMTEFQEKHTVSRLLGSPPGYVGYGEGGVLTEAVRQQPYSVVLFDEVEKAHPDILNLFYQLFDKGILSDGEGKVINFANTVIVMTSNLGSESIIQLNQQAISQVDPVSEAIRPLLSKHFKPALLARMRVVPFMRLPESVLREIVQLKLQRLAAALQESHRVALQVEEAVSIQIAERCLDTDSGARNIDAILQGKILPALSYGLLQRLSQGESIQQIGLRLTDQGEIICHFDTVPAGQEVA